MAGSKSTVGIIINILCVLFVVGALIWWFFIAETKKDPIVEKLGDAESAMLAYLETADHFIGQRKHFDTLEQLVLKEDMEWFQANWRSIFEKQDVLNLRSAIDPSTVEAGGRRVVMNEVLQWGPHRQDVQILDRQIGPNSARFTVRQKLEFGNNNVEYTDYRVYLEKEKDLWRVKDFAGFRAALENRLGREDRIRRSREEVESAATETTSAAAAAEPAAEEAPAANGEPAPDTLEYADMMVSWARAYWERGDIQSAHNCAAEALRIRTNLLGADDERTKQAALMLEQAKAALAQ